MSKILPISMRKNLFFSGLHRQASYLKDYLANGFLDSDLQAYEAQRNQNWEDISNLLGLK